MENKKEYRYKLNNMNESSQKYGVCEVCGKHVSEVYHQIEERKYFDNIDQEYSYTQYKCKNLFGHKDCLISQRR